MIFRQADRKITLSAVLALLSLTAGSANATYYGHKAVFERVAAFPVFLNTDIEDETVAEIVAASDDGNTLVYTDSEQENLGFVDIANPSNPQAAGIVELGGEPTSVAVAGDYALVAVNTSADFVNTSGELIVINIDSQTIVATLPLSGQPDSVAVSPDNRYAAIAIENERDEDLGDGEPPQAPAGFLAIVDLVGEPSDWAVRNVNLTGLADLFPEDPEPEYVDINSRNIAVVTMQENNHIVLVDLTDGSIVNDFNAGTVDLNQIDTNENDLIELNSSLTDVPREADGVSWINNRLFATADEGDLNGGSRGFTIYNKDGSVLFSSGNSNEHIVARLGHYPEDRSENKGNEPENIEFAVYGKGYNKTAYLFVGSERSSVVFVYRLSRFGLKLVQVLPAGVAPEGLLAIPQRDLFIAASEDDDRGDKFRSVLNIYQLDKKKYGWSLPSYPTVVSKNRADGTPIPWAALSGLAADKRSFYKAYAVHDSFYQQSRIFAMNVWQKPAKITKEIVLNDAMGLLAALDPAMVNENGTVNLDLEGIETSYKGGFWVVSEGRGTVGDQGRPFETFNLLLKVGKSGLIEQVVTLPETSNARQIRFGFEGVAATRAGRGELVYVAFQREWANDPEDHVRIGVYNTNDGSWRFFYYPLDAVESANGGWVGLSEITALGKDKFAVVERDNQAGPDAAVKRVYTFSVAGLTPLADAAAGEIPSFPVVEKSLARDLMPDLAAPGGLILEKVEGLTVLKNGTTLIVNDNDGVDDSNGETQLLRIRKLFK